MKKKRILIVTTVPETLDSILYEQPSFLNNHFDVYLSSSNGKTINFIEEREKIKVCIVPMKRRINPLYDIYSIIKMIILILRIKPDIIHSYTPKAGLVSMLSSYICRVPVRIHTFTGLIFPTTVGFKKNILMFVDRLICNCATEIVPEGNGVKNDLLSYGITKKNISPIGSGNIAGINIDYFNRDSFYKKNINIIQSLQKEIKLKKNNFVFCYIGRLNKDKGINELIESFCQLPEHTILLIVGEIDTSSPISDSTFQTIKTHPRIHALGFKKDIRPALAVTDVFVLPSYREGFPNVLLQAGSMSLPAIATDVNGCNEIINHKENGWIVRPQDSESLFQTMNQSMSTSNLDKMGIKARQDIVMKFERKAHWERMVQFYNQLVGSNEKIF